MIDIFSQPCVYVFLIGGEWGLARISERLESPELTCNGVSKVRVPSLAIGICSVARNRRVRNIEGQGTFPQSAGGCSNLLVASTTLEP